MTPDRLSSPAASNDAQAPARRYWQRVRLLTGVLLVAWALASFGVVFYARELAGVTLLGAPLPFYMAAQGTMIIYLAIIGVYAYAMKKLDALAGKTGSDDDGE